MHSEWWLRIWQVAVLGLGALAAAVLSLSLAYAPRVIIPGVEGFLGYEAAGTRFEGIIAHRITRLLPESGLRSAGVAPGDVVVDPPRGTYLVGQEVELQIARGTEVHRVRVAAAHTKELSTPLDNAMDLGTRILALFLGVTIGWRKRRDLGALVLASAFFLAVVTLIPLTISAGVLARVQTLLSQSASVLAVPALAYFVLVFEGGYESRFRSLTSIAIAILVFVAITLISVFAAYFVFGRPWVDPHLMFQIKGVVLMAGVTLCVIAFADAWRHADIERRGRLRWLLFAFTSVLLGVCLVSAYLLFGQVGVAPALVEVLSDALCAAAMVMLAYAVLRHHVVDVGFVINRAVVFAAFTAALVVSFGAIEWLINRFVHFEQRERKAARGPVGIGGRTSFPQAALALPMFRRSELVGFVILGEKAAQERYRPDEIENLRRTVREVGFDLFALQLDQLERQGRELEQRYRGLREGLRSVLQRRFADPVATEDSQEERGSSESAISSVRSRRPE